jgi:hypothetical protein
VVNLVFYLVPNLHVLRFPCRLFGTLVNLSGFIRWTAWNTVRRPRRPHRPPPPPCLPCQPCVRPPAGGVHCCMLHAAADLDRLQLALDRLQLALACAAARGAVDLAWRIRTYRAVGAAAAAFA